MDRIGILALQGDYAAHAAALRRAGAGSFEARSAEDVESARAMVIPGIESAVMGSLLLRFGVMDALVGRVREGIEASVPGAEVLASCRGEPVLARQGRIVGASSHPELNPDAAIHRWFAGS
jgi:pyridoxal 5'-phosphate synthase pdxT subunit